MDSQGDTDDVDLFLEDGLVAVDEDDSDHSTGTSVADSSSREGPQRDHNTDIFHPRQQQGLSFCSEDPDELYNAKLEAKSREAQRVNDSMVYLDGGSVYTCSHCRTHLTSHDDIVSKSFHGRHGRAFLLGQCVNVTLGESEERRLITGLHTVCDIFCKRCKTLIGWTYLKAYEMSQKYKEGKFIIEKINLHLEERSCYDAAPPPGVKKDRWRSRSMGWGNEYRFDIGGRQQPMVCEYDLE